MKDLLTKLLDPMKESREEYQAKLQQKYVEEKLKQFRRSRMLKRK